MKLKPEHVCGYFPYDLYFLRYERKCIDDTVKPVVWSDNTHPVLTQLNPVTLNGFDYKTNKLVLHPLSDLLDEEKDLWIQFSEEFGQMDTQNLREAIVHDKWYSLDIKRAWEAKEILYKLHIDVYNLIKKGLAVDINTLKLDK